MLDGPSAFMKIADPKLPDSPQNVPTEDGLSEAGQQAELCSLAEACHPPHTLQTTDRTEQLKPSNSKTMHSPLEEPPACCQTTVMI